MAKAKKQVEEQKLHYEPRDHEMVPKHKILNEEEVKQVLEKYKVTTKQLPKVKSNDVVVKSLEAKKGDVLEISRKSQTAGDYKYYRVVA